jgi:hypothetical protein
LSRGGEAISPKKKSRDLLLRKAAKTAEPSRADGKGAKPSPKASQYKDKKT